MAGDNLKQCSKKGKAKLKGNRNCSSVLGGVQRLQVSPGDLGENVIVSGTELTPAKTQNSTITSCPNDSYLRGECYLDISHSS